MLKRQTGFDYSYNYFELSIDPSCMVTMHQRYRWRSRQTDGQTTYSGNTALWTRLRAARGKQLNLFANPTIPFRRTALLNNCHASIMRLQRKADFISRTFHKRLSLRSTFAQAIDRSVQTE